MLTAIPTKNLNADIRIPVLGLGTGHEAEASGSSSSPNDGKLFNEAINLGYRHFDCSPTTEDEKRVGNALKNCIAKGRLQRRDFFITAKLRNTSMHPEKVESCLRSSLGNLQTDYVDLFLINSPCAIDPSMKKDENGVFYPDDDVDYTDTWRQLEVLTKKGFVKSIGVSNFNSYQLERLLQSCFIKPVVNQIESHPHFNNDDLIRFCQENEIHVTAFCPFGASGLTDVQVSKMAAKRRVTQDQICLKFAFQRHLSVVTKITTSPLLKSHMTAASVMAKDGFELTDGEMAALRAMSYPAGRSVDLLEYSNCKDYPFGDKRQASLQGDVQHGDAVVGRGRVQHGDAVVGRGRKSSAETKTLPAEEIPLLEADGWGDAVSKNWNYRAQESEEINLNEADGWIASRGNWNKKNKGDGQKKYFREVYETSIVRFDENNVFSRNPNLRSKSKKTSVSTEREGDDGRISAPTSETSSTSASSSTPQAEFDRDAPKPRVNLFSEAKPTRMSRASTFNLENNTRTELGLAFARLLGSEPERPALPEKHEKPRTGCEGFCIPGYCKGNSCKHPPNNQPALKGVLNIMSILMTPRRYDLLRELTTKSGIKIDDIIQFGVDQVKWNYMINKYYVPGTFFPVNCGVVAFDAECYSTFHSLFDAIIETRHNQYPVDGLHPRDCNPSHVDPEAVIKSKDGSANKIVLWCGVQADRNVVGFPWVPLMSGADRADLNGLVSGTLDDLPADFTGEYFDLDEVAPPIWHFYHDSAAAHKHHPKFSLPEEIKVKLPHLRFLKPPRPNPLREPHLTKDFPSGRDIWALDGGRFYIARNVRDHLCFVATSPGSSLRVTFLKWLRSYKYLESQFAKSHLHFAFDDHLGYLTANPASLGTAMTIAVGMRLPALHRFPLFDEILVHLRLRRSTELDFEPDLTAKEVRQSSEVRLSLLSTRSHATQAFDPCIFTIFNADRLGLTEVETFHQFVNSINRLIEVEASLAAAEVVNQDEFPRQILLEYGNLGRRSSVDSTAAASARGSEVVTPPSFSSDFPDLGHNKTVVAQILSHWEEQFKQFCTLKSNKGFSFKDAIQIGIDHPEGRLPHRNEIARVGMLVGDADCYQAFKPFLDELIPVLHSDYHEDGCHRTLSDLRGIEVDDALDLRNVVEIRIETRRNIAGFNMSPTINREDRRLIERIAVHCLGYLEHQKIEFEVKGRYFQYGHMEHMKQTIEEMGIKCLLFPIEDRVLHKKAGLLRDWPDGRGYWCNNERTLICNINEVDHLVFTSTERTAKLRSVFERHQLVLEIFALRLKEFAAKEFMHDAHFGFLTTCPGEVGTGTTIHIHMKLHHLFKNDRMFQRVLRKHRIRVEKINADTWDFYNIDSLGYPECDVVGLMYEGCKKILELDKFLGTMESEDWIENETKLPLRKIAHLLHCDMSWYAPLLFEPDEDEEASPNLSGDGIEVKFVE